MFNRVKSFVLRNQESFLVWGAFIMLLSIIGTVGNLVEDINNEDIAEKVVKALEEHEKVFLDSIKYIETRSFTIMDTEMRILHHTIPHKHGIAGCPDCAKALREANERQTDKVLE